jgi:hypothetical protein
MRRTDKTYRICLPTPMPFMIEKGLQQELRGKSHHPSPLVFSGKIFPKTCSLSAPYPRGLIISRSRVRWQYFPCCCTIHDLRQVHIASILTLQIKPLRFSHNFHLRRARAKNAPTTHPMHIFTLNMAMSTSIWRRRAPAAIPGPPTCT